MSLPLLLDGRFADYVAAARDDAALWLFVHVPKTAGSSLGAEMAARCRPYRNIHIDHQDRARPWQVRMDEALDGFLQANGARPFASASGHIQSRQVERIVDSIEGVRPVTMLRHPMARLVSDFRYQRSDMHPLNVEARTRAPSFEDFVRLPGQQNRMAKHLVPAPIIKAGDTRKAIDFILQRFTLVGLQESYDLFFRLFMYMISGDLAEPTERKRVNTEVEGVELTPDAEQAARALSAVDFAIYDHFQERLAPVYAPLEAWLGEQA